MGLWLFVLNLTWLRIFTRPSVPSLNSIPSLIWLASYNQSLSFFNYFCFFFFLVFGVYYCLTKFPLWFSSFYLLPFWFLGLFPVANPGNFPLSFLYGPSILPEFNGWFLWSDGFYNQHFRFPSSLISVFFHQFFFAFPWFWFLYLGG